MKDNATAIAASRQSFNAAPEPAPFDNGRNPDYRYGMRNWRQEVVLTAVLMAGWAMTAPLCRPALPVPVRTETATLAGGCFWSLQETLRQLPGVIKTTVGYTGGTTANPTYELVAAGKTGHTEAVQVVFDPARLSYDQLLSEFLTARNPARQSAAGTSHRAAIFYQDENQRQTAEDEKTRLNQSGKWSVPITVEINPATAFYPAEEYHQDYYRKHAAGRTCGFN
jgi:peptide-methionine (S)-S-oxide reductase